MSIKAADPMSAFQINAAAAMRDYNVNPRVGKAILTPPTPLPSLASMVRYTAPFNLGKYYEM